MNKVKNSMNWKPISVLAASLFLSACGGGGGGSSDAVAPTPGPSNSPVTPVSPAPAPSGTTVTGAITKGPVAGATVELFAMDAFGNATGTLVASASTDANGGFSITTDTSENLLVVTRGGVYQDESDQSGQRQITLEDTDTFLSVLPAGSATVAVTPFTTA